MTEEYNRRTLSIEEFYQVATLEQKKLLSDIFDKVQKEVEITKKINEIYKSIDNGIYSSDGGITICENDDDANVISLRLKIELEEMRKNIGVLLVKAVDKLNMGKIGMIERQYDNYVK